jgi:hypothetical protein
MTTPDDPLPMEPDPELMGPALPSGITGLVDTEEPDQDDGAMVPEEIRRRGEPNQE